MSCLTRTDILIHVVYGMDCPNGLLQLYLTCFDHYAPGCRWKKIIQLDGLPIQTGNDSIRYILKTRAEHVLMGRPRWDVIEEALEMMDATPDIQSINLTPLAQSEDPIDEDWRLCSGAEGGVKLLRAVGVPPVPMATSTAHHLAWVRDGTHANALLLGPWPVRLDVIQGGRLQEWVLEFAEREGVLLRGPSLR
jgi:hypothetical protein